MTIETETTKNISYQLLFDKLIGLLKISFVIVFIAGIILIAHSNGYLRNIAEKYDKGTEYDITICKVSGGEWVVKKCSLFEQCNEESNYYGCKSTCEETQYCKK